MVNLEVKKELQNSSVRGLISGGTDISEVDFFHGMFVRVVLLFDCG